MSHVQTPTAFHKGRANPVVDWIVLELEGKQGQSLQIEAGFRPHGRRGTRGNCHGGGGFQLPAPLRGKIGQ